MMLVRTLFVSALVAASSSSVANAFGPASLSASTALSSSLAPSSPTTSLQMAAESEVSFSDNLDGSTLRIGVLRTRWNEEHVTNLVNGITAAVKECKVDTESNLFIKEVPGAYELPYAAKLLAMSGTVDAIICCGVLIKGETYHFEYISEAVTKGIMDVNLSTMTPVIYGVLNCLDEEQVAKRSSDKNGGHNHGYDWGKTAVEMAIMRREALSKTGAGGGAGAKIKELEKMGFGVKGGEGAGVEKSKPGFF